MLEETNPSETTDYIYLGGLPIGTFDPSGSGKLYFVHTDRMGTPMAATNSAQSVVWATTYQPLGQTQTVVGSITQNLRLPGQYFDGETGFYHNGYRDYMPQLGHYLESDPIGLAGGYATFRFANHNPLAFTDRFGLSTGSPNPGPGTNTSGSGVNPSAGKFYECWIESKAPYGGDLVGAWFTLEGYGVITSFGPWKGQKPAACTGGKIVPLTVLATGSSLTGTYARNLANKGKLACLLALGLCNPSPISEGMPNPFDQPAIVNQGPTTNQPVEWDSENPTEGVSTLEEASTPVQQTTTELLPGAAAGTASGLVGTPPLYPFLYIGLPPGQLMQMFGFGGNDSN